MLIRAQDENTVCVKTKVNQDPAMVENEDEMFPLPVAVVLSRDIDDGRVEENNAIYSSGDSIQRVKSAGKQTEWKKGGVWINAFSTRCYTGYLLLSCFVRSV